MSERVTIVSRNTIFTMGLLFATLAVLFVGLNSFTNLAYAQTASPVTVNEQTQVTLSGINSFTPVPGNIISSYYWQQMAGDPVSFVNGGQTITFTTPSVAAGDVKTLRFALTVTDNHGATSSTAFVLQVVHIDHPPTVVTQHLLIVPELSQVTLTGMGTSPDNYSLTYTWTQTSGDAVQISSSGLPTATFTAPAVGSQQSKSLQFMLTADDGHGGQGSDYENVTVVSNAYYNSASIYCGGVIAGVRGTTVTLPATVNNPSNQTISYSWKQISGLQAQLSNATKLNPSFTVPNGPDSSEVGFQLTATSGNTIIGSCTSFVYTTIGFALPPTANAGPVQTVNGLDQVTLDGSKSTGIGALTYSWHQVSGIPVNLLYAKSANPQFVAPDVPVGSRQVLVFELAVSNGFGTGADQVQITVIHPNVPPTAIITMQ
jgi:hypothetical protein